MKNHLFKNKYRIASTRYEDWDYSSDGCYFVTICTNNRQCCLGTIVNEVMCLSKQGEIVRDCWHDLPNHYHNCSLDAFVVMPNHVHGVIAIDNEEVESMVVNNPAIVETGLRPVSTSAAIEVVETGLKPVSTPITTIIGVIRDNLLSNLLHLNKRYSLSEIIRGFKTFSAKKINLLQNTAGQSFWQPRFYDHIIRAEAELDRVRQYIFNNPVKWQWDEENPDKLWE